MSTVPFRRLVVNPDQDLAFRASNLTADALRRAGYFPLDHTAYIALGVDIAGDALDIKNPGMVVVGRVQPGYM